MADIKGFLKIKRQSMGYRPVDERIKDYQEVSLIPNESHSWRQASRCMDCGTPFCHWGCPIGNYIPEWNDFVFKKQWLKAYHLLSTTNNFPEITGRLCPAPCEYSCVLGINDEPVTIRENELAIIEYAFEHDYVKPHRLPPSGGRVAIIGSGPAGLACADCLNKLGHKVVIFERDDKSGGLLRYGIPDFKLEKRILDRRIELLNKEGVEFVNGIDVGKDIKVNKILRDFDCLCLANGCRVPRDLNIEGRTLKGIHFAIDYLSQANRRLEGKSIPGEELIDALDKKVVVIGGGDTGSDCIGLAHRQGARSVVQIEILPKPPDFRTDECPWPRYPVLLKTTTSHEEGCQRYWQVLTKRFVGEDGKVKKLLCAKVWVERDSRGCVNIKEIPDSEFEIDSDLVILALGFLYPEKILIEEFGLDCESYGNIKTDTCFMTSKRGIFACGDARRGQSLIVWAIYEGRSAAYHINRYLIGK